MYSGLQRCTLFYNLQAAAGADIVMFDNYTPEDLAKDAEVFKSRHPHVITESSGVRSYHLCVPPCRIFPIVSQPGECPHRLPCSFSFPERSHTSTCVCVQGITKDILPRYFSPFIDVVSMGSLTHGYSVADFSLKISKGAGVLAIEKATGV